MPLRFVHMKFPVGVLKIHRTLKSTKVLVVMMKRYIELSV